MFTKQEAQELFEYKNGELFWKKQKPCYAKLNKGAGWIDKTTGYRRVFANGKYEYVHRLIFLMHHGYVPKMIDHIDGDPLNNNLSNLREATKAQNIYNAKAPYTNTTGCKNVYFEKRSGKWFVKFVINGKQKMFGKFNDFIEAQQSAEKTRSFLHGDYARNA